MQNKLFNLLLCPNCNSGNLEKTGVDLCCSECLNTYKVIDEIPRFVDDDYHSNWGLQWNRFSQVQLDSFNGTNLSESRLLTQSGMNPGDFKDKKILEVGAGNGRFTEILLKYGAEVVAVDYSTAIEANYNNNHSHKDEIIFIQADLFCLPIKYESFDIVLCYGVLQHTGDSEKALLELSKYPKKIGGKLLVDIYSSGLKYYNPWVYIIRPFFSLIRASDKRKLQIVEKFVNLIFPLQLWLLRKLHNQKGILKIVRYIINRSPNSVYGINLYLDGKINLQLARDWSIMDTFDGWAPKHDHPVSRNEWINMLNTAAVKEDFSIVSIDESGQGHTASLDRG